MRSTLHLLAHGLVPALIVLLVPEKLLPRERRLRCWLLMVSTQVVDLDHLLADPIYDPDRCSIGFHPLHTLPAIVLYVVALVMPKIPTDGRWFALGLLIHMALDQLDCWMMSG